MAILQGAQAPPTAVNPLHAHQNHMVFDPCETATESRGKIGHQLDTQNPQSHLIAGFVPFGE